MTFLMMWFWRLFGCIMVIGTLWGFFFLAASAGLVSLNNPTKEGDEVDPAKTFSRKEALIAGLAMTLICSAFGWGSFGEASDDSTLLAKWEKQAAAPNRSSPVGEQEYFHHQLSVFDVEKYRRQLKSLGSLDTEGKERVAAECMSAANEIYASIKTYHAWTATVSLTRCTYEAISNNEPFCQTDESNIAAGRQLNSIHVTLEDRTDNVTFFANYIQPNESVYALLLKLHDGGKVVFTAERQDTPSVCSVYDLEQRTGGLLEMGGFGGEVINVHLLTIETAH
jgi:hypothetical protein